MYNSGITQKQFVISGVSLFMTICLAVLLKTDIIPLTFFACVYPLLSLGILALVLSMIYISLLKSTKSYSYYIHGNRNQKNIYPISIKRFFQHSW